MEDDARAAALRRGSREAFASWVERLQPRVFRYARRKLGNPEDALDTVQETFVAAFGGLSELPADPRRQVSWLFGIASHKITDALRRRGRRREDALPEEAALPSPVDPAREALDRHERDRVLAALRHVEEPFREALVLASVEGLSYPEIAAAQGCPVGTVRSRIATARQRLRATLALGKGTRA